MNARIANISRHRSSLFHLKSMKSAHAAGQEQEEIKEDLADVGFGQLLKMNKPEWPYMLGEFSRFSQKFNFKSCCDIPHDRSKVCIHEMRF